MTSRENDNRLAVLNSFLSTPHREIVKNHAIHRDLLEHDPEFYGKLAIWYTNTGSVRDHQDLFVANLISAKDTELRAAGLFLLRNLPPHRVGRVVDFFQKNIRKALPNSLRTEIQSYLWEREENLNRFDRAVLTGSRKVMKHLYMATRTPHSDYVQKVLFEDNPPEGSVHAVLKMAAKETDPTKQARLLLEHKIPYRIVSSVLTKMTPAGMVALISGMTPADVINNMDALKERGATDNADLKKLIKQKLEAAKTDKRVAQSALKSEQAVKAAANLDEDLVQTLQDVADTQMKAKGRIKRATALLVDKSHSLVAAIEVAKELGVTISAQMDDGVPLHVIAFDNVARKIEVKGTTRAAWQDAFRNVKADGSTSIGSGVARLTRDEAVVEQIVVITDEGENAEPKFVKAYKEYTNKFRKQFDNLGSDPHVMIVHVGSPSNYLANQCKEAGIPYEVMSVNEKADSAKKNSKESDSVDRYAIPNIVPFLMRKTRLDLLMDILDLSLPARQAQVRMPQIVAERTV